MNSPNRTADDISTAGAAVEAATGMGSDSAQPPTIPAAERDLPSEETVCLRFNCPAEIALTPLEHLFARPDLFLSPLMSAFASLDRSSRARSHNAEQAHALWLAAVPPAGDMTRPLHDVVQTVLPALSSRICVVELAVFAKAYALLLLEHIPYIP